MNVSLFFDRESALYYYGGEPVCQKCDLEIQDVVAVFLVNHPKRNWSKGALYCHKCLQSVLKSCPVCLVAAEIIPVRVGVDVPETAFTVPVQRISLVDGSPGSVFDVALSNRGVQSDASSCVVADHTRLSGRECWEGVMIGLSPDDVSRKERVLSDVDVDAFLLGEKEAQPVLPCETRRLLS